MKRIGLYNCGAQISESEIHRTVRKDGLEFTCRVHMEFLPSGKPHSAFETELIESGSSDYIG